jgi:hypothetical protein
VPGSKKSFAEDNPSLLGWLAGKSVSFREAPTELLPLSSSAVVCLCVRGGFKKLIEWRKTIDM